MLNKHAGNEMNAWDPFSHLTAIKSPHKLAGVREAPKSSVSNMLFRFSNASVCSYLT